MPGKAPDDAPCRYCGAVLPVAQLVRIDAEGGGYVLACQDCAVVAATGRGPESRR